MCRGLMCFLSGGEIVWSCAYWVQCVPVPPWESGPLHGMLFPLSLFGPFVPFIFVLHLYISSALLCLSTGPMGSENFLGVIQSIKGMHRPDEMGEAKQGLMRGCFRAEGAP